MTTANASSNDPAQLALARLIATLAEDAVFVGAATANVAPALDALAKRRADVYASLVRGGATPGPPRMSDEFDRWIVDLARAMAPIASPAWLPMGEVVREKVTLEIGARGLRSLFSSKPSEKDVIRVRRLGTFAVRTLRAVLAADGPIDGEEMRTIAALVASLGLADADAAALLVEAPLALDQVDPGGDVEPGVARGLVRGAWLAAAWDGLDPREEEVVRAVAKKVGSDAAEVEAMRAEAIARVEARRQVGLGAIDGVRYVLADRGGDAERAPDRDRAGDVDVVRGAAPGLTPTLAAHVGRLLLPRRHRDEGLAPTAHGAPVVLARRYVDLAPDDRACVLGVTWAAAVHDDPTLGRRALLAARHERFANDLGEDGAPARGTIDAWLDATLAPICADLR